MNLPFMEMSRAFIGKPPRILREIPSLFLFSGSLIFGLGWRIMIATEPMVFVVDDDQRVRDSPHWLITPVDMTVETFASVLECRLC